MKTSIIYLFSLIFFSSLAFADPIIPWPIAPTGSTHTLYHSYGDYHTPLVDAAGGGINFHYGIDIADPDPDPNTYEPVYCVYDGIVRRLRLSDNNMGWYAIVEDDLSTINGDAWMYSHISDNASGTPPPKPVGYIEGDPLYAGDIAGYIAHVYGYPDNHLHFMRTEEPAGGWHLWESKQPGNLNPLFYFDPAPIIAEGFDWSWKSWPINEFFGYTFFVLPQIEALGTGTSGWKDRWSSISACQNEAQSPTPSNPIITVNGEVDLFLHFYTNGVKQVGIDPQFGSMPQRFKWWIERELPPEGSGNWTTAMGNGNDYIRFLFDFGDIELGADTDSDAYQRLFFRYSAQEMNLPSLKGYLCCLTNCGDAPDWTDLGISNIEEECWKTDLHVSGSGTATSELDAMFPDGSYRIHWEAYAFDGSADGVLITPEGLDPSNHILINTDNNLSPITSVATFSNAAADEVYWDAGWEVVETTDGYELQFVVNTDESTYPTGQTVDVEIHFSESMNPNCSPAPTIMLQVETGYCPQLSGSFSSTTVENDTWTGTAILPPIMLPGRITLLVSCQDMSGNWLIDPANPGHPFMDNYHGFDLAFGIEEGWPVSVHDEVRSSPKLADIDLDGDLDVIIQSADGYVDVLNDDGNSMWAEAVSTGWDPTYPDVWASPAIVNLTGVPSSTPEILAVNPSGCLGFTATGLEITPWSADLPYMNRWFAHCSPVAGDFTGDGNNEFAMGRQNRNLQVGDPFIPFNILVRDNSGLHEWFTMWGAENEEESVSSTPSLSDVDNDGYPNLLVVSEFRLFPYAPLDPKTPNHGTLYCLNTIDGSEEWNTYVGGEEIVGAIATGNLDSDAALEIVVGATTGSNSINVLDGIAGTIQYTKSISGEVYAGASIADIDGDGDNDFVVSSSGSGGMLYCWDGPTGNSLPGFPLSLGTWTDDGISIGDIDSDDHLELVIAGKDGKLHVINHDGSSTGGFPVTVSTANALSGQPALGDIDGDGRLEIVFGEVDNSVIHCYEMADNSAFTYLPWPQFQHDAANTGYFPTDNTAPGAPSSLSETHTYDGDAVKVNLSWTASPDDPGDVICYRIYRQIYGFYNNYTMDPIGTAGAGITTFEDRFRVYPGYLAVEYTVSAWDGLNESDESNGACFRFGGGIILSSGCPVREIMHSSAIGTSSSQAVTGISSTSTSIAIGTSSSSAIDNSEHRNNCGILTDGNYDAVYTPSSSSDCIEIDLGGVFTVSDVAVIRSDQSLIDSQNYEFSIDGGSFSTAETGRARYVRVYNVTGATEVEIIGTTCEENSALIEIQRSTDNGYRIATVESGSPITATIFDLSGRSVWSSASSTGEVLWNRCNSSGNTVPAGVYLIMVESDDMETFTSKVIVR